MRWKVERDDRVVNVRICFFAFQQTKTLFFAVSLTARMRKFTYVIPTMFSTNVWCTVSESAKTYCTAEFSDR